MVGRRLDPVTGKIYHLKYSPPETEEIAARLTQRFDDTEEKAFFNLVLAVLVCVCVLQQNSIFVNVDSDFTFHGINNFGII